MGLGVFIFLSAAGAATPCYAVEPKIVTVTGTLVEKAYPGPPNFESVKNGDREEKFFLLRFKPPICTIGYTPDEMGKTGYYDESHSSIAEMQLVFLDDAGYLYDKLRPSLGKQIQCTGTLFDTQTVNHRTPVLVQVMHKDDCKVVSEK
jgi:hypothetical protein